MSTQIRGNKQIKDISISNDQIAVDAGIETSKLAEGAELFKRDGSVAATGNINLNSHQIKNVAAPVDSNDAVRKVDLDTEIASVQSDIDSLDVRVSDLEAHDVVQDGRLDGVEAKNTEQDGRLTTAEADIVALEGRADVSESDIVALEGRMTTAEADIVAIEAKDVEQDDRLSLIETKNTQQDGRLTTAEADIAALEAADVAFDTRVSNLEDGLQAETVARQNADTALQSSISSEASTRAAADVTLQSNIDAEAAARVAGDADLASDIAAEEAARIAGDASLAADISAEAAARVAGDASTLTSAQSYTDQKISDLVNGAPQVLDTLKELADALGGDENFAATLANNLAQINSDIDAEEAARIAGDSALDVRMTAAEADIVQLQADLAEATNGVFVTREVPAGSVNGVNTTFTLANSPNVGSEQVFINGNLLNPGAGNDYTISDTVITMSVAPEAGDVVLVNYISDGVIFVTGDPGSGGSGATNLNGLTDVTISSPSANQVLKYNGSQWVNATISLSGSSAVYDAVVRETPSGSVNGSNAVFVLAQEPLANTEQVFLNGILQQPGALNDYTISGSTITFNSAPESGWKVLVTYNVASVSGGGAVDTSAIEADIVALDGRVDALEAVVPFSGSYNDLSDKPTIPSLTQVEADIDALEAADVVLDSRVDALEAADVALDSRLDSAEATLITLDGRIDALEAGGGSGGGSGGSGAIEVYQDAEFNWSGDASSRTIVHNKGRQPDMIKVFCKETYPGYSTIWREHFDLAAVQGGNANYGWSSQASGPEATNNNQTTVRLFRSNFTSPAPTRIRLYWFGNNDIGTTPAGAYTVGGGSGATKVESVVFTWPQTSPSSYTLYTFTHNRGTPPDIIKVMVTGQGAGGYVEHYDFYYEPGSGAYGYYINEKTDNAVVIRFYARGMGGGTNTKIVGIWL